MAADNKNVDNIKLSELIDILKLQNEKCDELKENLEVIFITMQSYESQLKIFLSANDYDGIKEVGNSIGKLEEDKSKIELELTNIEKEIEGLETLICSNEQLKELVDIEIDKNIDNLKAIDTEKIKKIEKFHNELYLYTIDADTSKYENDKMFWYADIKHERNRHGTDEAYKEVKNELGITGLCDEDIINNIQPTTPEQADFKQKMQKNMARTEYLDNSKSLKRDIFEINSLKYTKSKTNEIQELTDKLYNLDKDEFVKKFPENKESLQFFIESLDGICNKIKSNKTVMIYEDVDSQINKFKTYFQNNEYQDQNKIQELYKFFISMYVFQKSIPNEFNLKMKSLNKNLEFYDQVRETAKLKLDINQPINANNNQTVQNNTSTTRTVDGKSENKVEVPEYMLESDYSQLKNIMEENEDEKDKEGFLSNLGTKIKKITQRNFLRKIKESNNKDVPEQRNQNESNYLKLNIDLDSLSDEQRENLQILINDIANNNNQLKNEEQTKQKDEAQEQLENSESNEIEENNQKEQSLEIDTLSQEQQAYLEKVMSNIAKKKIEIAQKELKEKEQDEIEK